MNNESKINVKTSAINANQMSKIKQKIKRVEEVGDPNFDWSLYDKGWNGKSLKSNPDFKNAAKQAREKVYSFEAYAKEEYDLYKGINPKLAKDESGIVYINNLKKLDKDNILASVNDGANDIVININKEAKYLSLLSSEAGTEISKDTFMNLLESSDGRKSLLELNIPVELSKNMEKASIWNGHTKNLEADMKRNITDEKNAYYCKILHVNNGGYIVEVAKSIKAFMPTSMAAMNRITNPEELVGKNMEVMVESYNSRFGFIVSRKKYLKRVMPAKIAELNAKIKENPDLLFEGKVTGTTPFGIFIELDEYLTGMIHKTLVSDELKAKMKSGQIKAGDIIPCYVHTIDNIGRIILSDVPRVEREAVIAIREKEDEDSKKSKNASSQKSKKKDKEDKGE